MILLMNDSSKTTLPAFAYQGGKRNLAKRLIERIEAIPHKCYCEPFVGAGGIFLRRTVPAKSEVINDLNRNVATFFRVVQRHYTPFMEMIRYQITSRAEFERLSKTDPETLTDMERAAAFLYLQRGRYMGKVHGTSMRIEHDRGGWFDVATVGPMIEAIHERLSGVSIECLGYQRCIEVYDRKHTLFYLDPPYFGTEKTYGKDLFSRADFANLAAILAKLKGQFLMSINDTPEIRDIFSAFKIEEIETIWSMKTRANSGGGKVGELVISNAMPTAGS